MANPSRSQARLEVTDEPFNAHGRKLANHKACVALWVAWYNMCRVNTAVRMTPAMAAGITDHIWTVSELLQG